MPCVEVFEQQAPDYKAHVLPEGPVRLAVEAGVPDGWWRYVGRHGRVVGMTTFGKSAPAKALFEYFGFTVNAVLDAARGLLSSVSNNQ
jgi:transketolase